MRRVSLPGQVLAAIAGGIVVIFLVLVIIMIFP